MLQIFLYPLTKFVIQMDHYVSMVIQFGLVKIKGLSWASPLHPTPPQGLVLFTRLNPVLKGLPNQLSSLFLPVFSKKIQIVY